jgi:hypothetical protein
MIAIYVSLLSHPTYPFYPFHVLLLVLQSPYYLPFAEQPY